jgi:hypothetical protein
VSSISWTCKTGWLKSAKNTFWCFVGCTVGNMVAVLFFQHFIPAIPNLAILITAPLIGLITSIGLESLILIRQMDLKTAVKVAFGMSFISMITMQVVSNLSLWLLAGDIKVSGFEMIPSLLIGFMSVWPYNYYKLKRFGKKCH